ncbi:P-II family nitrogen regulator [Methanobrevibacter curvatus]|uniref:Nitrogen regulatory protein P-II n=1 Tax=Methanobrevibacter curvatus TaxID=49547 RepID=A0A166DPM6_9EURY|nr:P-II family nitrogen regulator [Methanobrevibacter curvatus]KZX15825.1 nitrogen regulatory protein P-II [Methanobrevibacter curvatus]
MKKIVAIIRPEKLTDVKNSLIAIGAEGMNVVEVKGRGRQLGIKERYRGSNYCIDMIPKTRVEVIVKAEDLDKTVDAIVSSARTDEIGDGKIFVSSLDNVIRIRTGEEGKDAI